MPLNTFKNSRISRFLTKFKIYGFRWSLIFVAIAIKRYFINILLLKSFSQYGEDIIVEKLLKHKANIFYVDIGSNHPKKYNNTYRFYQQNSRGIIVEPNSRLTQLHQQSRPEDIILNNGISDHEDNLIFYELYPDVASTFSKQELNKCLKSGAKLIRKSKIHTITLSQLFKSYRPSNNIDFLSVDTEGHDLEVLSGNDWNRYRPQVICVESLEDNGVHELLEINRYRRVYQNAINSIYETIT